MSVKKQIGNRIKELRIKSNLKQSELAEMVGIATKHQSCIETGRNFPSAELFEKYAKAFNIEISDMFSLNPLPKLKSRKEVISSIKKNIMFVSDFDLVLIEKFINVLLQK